MAKNVVFIPDNNGIIALLKSDEVVANLLERGERVANAARSGGPQGETGDYVENIEVVVDENPTRKVVRVGSTVAYASRVEANTGNMARALDAAAG